LVSYLIGITDIDPIKHELLFERFYSDGRNVKEHISFPEFSIQTFKNGV
jgi:DNA polymerase III alpha subunit